MKQKYKKDWCILITTENKEKVKQYLSSLDTNIKNYSWSIGAYYGIVQDGYVYGSGAQVRVSHNLITDKEFDEMVQYFSLQVFLDNYEIY